MVLPGLGIRYEQPLLVLSGMIAHLLVLSVTIFAFSLLIFMIARQMLKSDFPLCRPMILTLVGIAALGQLVRSTLMLWEGIDNLDWAYSVKTMIIGATVTAAFGVVIVVILVAECGRAQLRPSDLFARLGGDEFALLLPESDAEVALEVARRLHAALRSTPLKTQAGPYGLTGSFGVAVSDDPQDTVAQILKRADQALYRVKENGRDGVAAFAPAQAVQA